MPASRVRALTGLAAALLLLAIPLGRAGTFPFPTPARAASVAPAGASPKPRPAARGAARKPQVNPVSEAAKPPADSTEAMNPLVYMTWRRPYGAPGAVADITPSTTPEGRDTLWLVAEPRATVRLYGIGIQLAFHAAPGDTLGPEWIFGGTDENSRHVHVEWPQRSWPVKNPWQINGFGGVHYERRGDAGVLKIIYAVNSDSAAVVKAGTRYALARLSFPSMSAAAARRPVCIEWESGEWAYDLSGLEGHPALGGSRFVSVASPSGSVCTPHRVAQRLDRFRYGLPSTQTPRH